MPQVLSHCVLPPSPCLYLPGASASLEYKTMLEVTPAEYQQLLARGWRRFGVEYFRPVCAACAACVSLRVPVQTFRPSKSQRRALRKCGGFRLEIGSPQVDPGRQELFARWHAMREADRGWPETSSQAEEFLWLLAWPHPCAREFAYYDGSRLVAVGMVDETSEALSSVYFYFDPAYKRSSLGVASVLLEVEVARRQGLSHVYLGYRILGCASMEYKQQFRPHELLAGRPSLEEAPVWVPESKE